MSQEQDYAAEERLRGAAKDMRDALEHIGDWVSVAQEDRDLTGLALQQIGLQVRIATAKAEGRS